MVHRDVEELRRMTKLRPDLYRYWFRFVMIYPSTYVCCNEVEDLGDAWRLEDVGWYHPDKSKSTSHHLIVSKTMVTQLSQPPSLR